MRREKMIFIFLYTRFVHLNCVRACDVYVLVVLKRLALVCFFLYICMCMYVNICNSMYVRVSARTYGSMLWLVCVRNRSDFNSEISIDLLFKLPTSLLVIFFIFLPLSIFLFFSSPSFTSIPPPLFLTGHNFLQTFA